MACTNLFNVLRRELFHNSAMQLGFLKSQFGCRLQFCMALISRFKRLPGSNAKVECPSIEPYAMLWRFPALLVSFQSAENLARIRRESPARTAKIPAFEETIGGDWFDHTER